MSELVQYYVVNKDLIKTYDISAGKIAAQIAHAATVIAVEQTHKNDPLFFEWFKKSQAKIVLKASEKELHKLIKEGFYSIVDEGRTEIPNGSLTVVGLPPMPKEEAQKYVKKFQLL